MSSLWGGRPMRYALASCGSHAGTRALTYQFMFELGHGCKYLIREPAGVLVARVAAGPQPEARGNGGAHGRRQDGQGGFQRMDEIPAERRGDWGPAILQIDFSAWDVCNQIVRFCTELPIEESRSPMHAPNSSAGLRRQHPRVKLRGGCHEKPRHGVAFRPLRPSTY